MSDKREELLLRMYDQMFNDINRHILVVWQSIGTLVGACAAFTLVEKQLLTLDIATCIIVLLCCWLLAHLHDAAYWYNRNLAIAANIERQFLRKEDLREVHYYFGRHRPKNRMLTHLRIQYGFGIVLAGVVLGHHGCEQAVPAFVAGTEGLSLSVWCPYVLAVVCTVLLAVLKSHRNASYAEFLLNSPGRLVDTEGIVYGVGHGFRAGDQDK